MAGIGDLAENTGDWHVAQAGMLLTQLQLLEFNARRGIATKTGSPMLDFRALTVGEWITENPMTNYDQLKTVLTRFNELAPERGHLDVSALVELRDQLAHSRVIPYSSTTPFPLILLKLGPSRQGKVQLLARIEMNADWFTEKRQLLDLAINTVGLWP